MLFNLKMQNYGNKIILLNIFVENVIVKGFTEKRNPLILQSVINNPYLQINANLVTNNTNRLHNKAKQIYKINTSNFHEKYRINYVTSNNRKNII